ncbi:MAG: NAD(P)H-binding protein [Anaerolineales bacterium]|nr:NAD(P)H-binding protein [Anaerolineales bacterium]
MLLITGSTGFIGRDTVRSLTSEGHSIRTLLRPSRKTPNLPRGVPVEVALSSLEDPRGVRAALVDVDAVIHLASGERYGSRDYDPDLELEGTRNLANAAADAGVNRFIYLSQLGAEPTSAYVTLRAKAMCEDSIRRSGIPFTIIRSGIVFGPQDRFTSSLAMMLALAPGFFLVPGSGETLLQPLWIEDLITTIAWTLDEEATVGGTYDIGGPEFLSFRRIVQMVMQRTRLRRVILASRPPLLRAGAWFMERLLPDPPINSHWIDYLAVNRTAELQTLPRVFGLQPSRMETKLDYLKGKNWTREFISMQLKGRRKPG